ncbi:flavodoxin-dependent (E)-4-hydroxy-3-methylbut-2-enyl-diphosphate synthase [bacterium]|nr:flavodoxin-dependent (E)-4-hydroxy-3-methylbut-2-enyl-diphosphate synthase [bacterium]
MKKGPRFQTRSVAIGPLHIGRGAPVVVQSMTNTKTHEPGKTLGQIRRLAKAGCELVRVAVPDQAAVAALPQIVKKSPLPIVADIHFDYKLALAAIAAKVAKVRLNPGNMGLPGSLEVARAAVRAQTAIRIGVNAGSIAPRERKTVKTPEALGRLMARKAMQYAAVLAKTGLDCIVLSVKASDIQSTLSAYRTLAKQSPWPLHLGITEAGGELAGGIKTAAGISPLLLEGIGDTLRVSLTEDPVKEIRVADMILAATGVRKRGPEIIACPTCGRTTSDLQKILKQVERALATEKRTLTVAVMGCVVNGPGEARHADVGIAGAADGSFMLFAKGKPVKRVAADKAVQALLQVIWGMDKKLQGYK